MFRLREDPKIVVAVVVENGDGVPAADRFAAGGNTRTIRCERKRLSQLGPIAGVNLMPKYLVRLQFRRIAATAARWARQTGIVLLIKPRRLRLATMLDTSGNVNTIR